jgi:CRISPR-associated protein Csx17
MNRHDLALSGCTPEPLMGYLKALGVLRLVSQQRDPDARGCWRDGSFVLRSELDERALIQFFGHQGGFRPSPVFAPWNGDGGFISEGGKSAELVAAIRASSAPELSDLAGAVRRIDEVRLLREFAAMRTLKKDLENRKKVLKKSRRELTDAESEDLRRATRRVEEIKNAILFEVRSSFPDEVVRWLDACVAILPDGFGSSPLLGSGGCDGRMEFSANYLSNVLIFHQEEVEQREQWVKVALLASGTTKLSPTVVGQFAPGQVGGPNATQGFEGDSRVNPLDFILMIEGAMIMSGAATRRYGISRAGKAAFPFTVHSSPVGYGSRNEGESRSSRGEIWLPLWPRFASSAEISHLLSEGRAELGGRQATSGVDFSRSVASLGVDRGIDEFVRYGFLPRSGKNSLATPLGRFPVMARPEADLIRELDPWLDRFRPAGADEHAPPRFRSALRRIEGSLFDFCRHGGAPRFAAILCALGRAERELASGERFRAEKFLRPIAGLTQAWVSAADDGSDEFRLALALASVHDPGRRIGPLRANLEPVSTGVDRHGRSFATWQDKDRSVVWSGADLCANLAAVLERRVMDANRKGGDAVPLAAHLPAPLDAVAAFIAGRTDDDRLTDLLWGLMLVDPRTTGLRMAPSPSEAAPSIPRVFALLKLLHAPEVAAASGVEAVIRPEPAVYPLLRAGRMSEACAIALSRLSSAGLIPMTTRRGGRRTFQMDWSAGDVDPRRILAALLIPISVTATRQLARLVLRPATEKHDIVA